MNRITPKNVWKVLNSKYSFAALYVLTALYYRHALSAKESKVRNQSSFFVVDVLLFILFQLPSTIVKRAMGIKANPNTQNWRAFEEFLFSFFHYFARGCSDSQLRSVIDAFGTINRYVAFPLCGLHLTFIPPSEVGYSPKSEAKQVLGNNVECTAYWISLDKKITMNTPDVKVILFYHGGGFTFGNSTMYPPAFEVILRGLKKKGMTNCGVLSVDYPLSPQFKHPIPINACIYVYKHLFAAGKIKPENCIIMGDSAGGNIACNVAIEATKYGAAGVVLVSPWIGHKHDTVSHDTNAEVDFVGGKDLLEKNHRLMFRESKVDLHGSVRNLISNDSKLDLVERDFIVLPPCYISVGESEVFRDDIYQFNKNLRNAGVDTEMHIGKTQPHIYPLLYPLLQPESSAALEEIAEFCFKRFNTMEQDLSSLKQKLSF